MTHRFHRHPVEHKGGVKPPLFRPGPRHLASVAIAILLAAAPLTVPIAAAQQQRQAAPPAATQPAPAATSRTEILTYDNWTVTCREVSDAKDRRTCSAELNIFREANNARRVVFSWLLGLDKAGKLAMALRFPPGVSVQPGVELKFADKPARRLAINTCEPAWCEVSQPMDDVFVREATVATQANAMIVASDGRQVTFTIFLKGFAQAVAAVRK